MFKMFFIIPISAIYFFISWFTPWHELAPGSTISASYLFDLIFIFTIFAWNKKLILFGAVKPSGLILRLLLTIALGISCIAAAVYYQVAAPFKYVDHLLIQMLILAPLIEEFVFRESFFVIQKKLGFRGNWLLLFNSLLFGFSHISGVFLLPSEFHAFVYMQTMYTIPLGWVCAKAKVRTGGIGEPIILHLVFNLMFYYAVLELGL